MYILNSVSNLMVLYAPISFEQQKRRNAQFATRCLLMRKKCNQINPQSDKVSLDIYLNLGFITILKWVFFKKCLVLFSRLSYFSCYWTHAKLKFPISLSSSSWLLLFLLLLLVRSSCPLITETLIYNITLFCRNCLLSEMISTLKLQALALAHRNIENRS